MKQVIVLNGIHGSGKSTLGRMLASQIGGTYYLEIGGELRKQTADGTMQSGEAFDRQVMEAEFSRDEEIFHAPGAAVIETWHFGNLAYAQNRSPRVFAHYLERLPTHLLRFQVTGILLEIDKPVFLRRMSEKVSAEDLPSYIEFFQGIRHNTGLIYGNLSVPCHAVWNTGCLEDALNEILCCLGSEVSFP